MFCDGDGVVERFEQLLEARIGPVVNGFGDEAELDHVGWGEAVEEYGCCVVVGVW